MEVVLKYDLFFYINSGNHQHTEFGQIRHIIGR